MEALAVHLPAPHGHLDAQAIALRTRLRARARQLGDVRRSDRGHDIERLVEQCAYEHWHRMLFARFLAENDLLIHPEYGTAVTLAECAELAPAEGARDAWELAARYASRMLPQIFRSDDPVLEVRLPPEHMHELERLVASLPVEVFGASDSLGWVYQFWQARRKKEVNASEVKIGADELPAVTQLFTEQYMVQVLLQNTLGAWWLGAGRPLPMEMPYLRRREDGTPAAGRFEDWPKHARELKVLDPCCGSGHFLVAAFEILVPFRMQEEQLSAREACDAVLRENLYGLEIDYRCTQIAAFALALAAWRHPGAAGWRPLPALNLACSGVAISSKKDSWIALGGEDSRLRKGMARMHELFADAPVLGSLIDARRDPPDPLLSASFDELRPVLERALANERTATEPEEHEARVAAKGIADAALLLGQQFHLVITNVPYLAKHKQNATLQAYCAAHFESASTDLATVFLCRCIHLAAEGGSIAVVTPTIWTTYTREYENLRRHLLRSATWNFLGRLGKRAFTTIGGEVVDVVVLGLTRKAPSEDSRFPRIEATHGSDAIAKAVLLRESALEWLSQNGQLTNPGATIAAEEATSRLCEYATAFEGLSRGDAEQFDRCFWEIQQFGDSRHWKLLIESPDDAAPYSGRSTVMLWEDGTGRLARHPSARIQGLEAWGKPGVVVSRTHLNATLSCGEAHAQNCVCIVPKNERDLAAIYVYCDSEEYRDAIAALNQKLIKPTGVMDKTAIDIGLWRTRARSKFGNGLPPPESWRPDQWYFDGSIPRSTAPLHVAVARLLGYRWPRQRADGLEALADQDGIVCLPAVRGERAAADRLVDVLAKAYARDWYPQRVQELLTAVGFGDRSLEDWLRNGFFEQHCRLFHQRPFVWQVTDGHRSGFSALLNYHRLDRKGLESLTYTYLGDWISFQERANKVGESGAGDRLAKAKELQRKLELVIEGEAPYDIFARWKPIEDQPIGWEPSLEDGVRINIRPFVEAGVLRWQPNIKWNKDRGKNPPGSPWGEERNNDIHLTLLEKRRSRGLR